MRKASLGKVKHIFNCLDLAYKEYEEQIEERRKEVARESEQRKQRQDLSHKEKLRALYKGSGSAAVGQAQGAAGKDQDKEASKSTGDGGVENSTTAIAAAFAASASTETGTTTAYRTAASPSSAAPNQSSTSDLSEPIHKKKSGETSDRDLAEKTAKQEAISSGSTTNNNDSNNNNNNNMGAVLSRKPVEVVELLSDSDDEIEPPKQPQKETSSEGKQKRDEGSKLAEPASTAAASSNRSNYNENGNGNKKDQSMPEPDDESKKLAQAEEEKKELEKYLSAVESKKNSIAIAFSSGRHPRSQILTPEFRQSKYPMKFLLDTKSGSGTTYSSSLREHRGHRDFSVFPHHQDARRSMYIGGATLDNIHERYSKWDPFWTCTSDFSILGGPGPSQERGLKTAPIHNASISYPDNPQTALGLVFQLPQDITREVNLGCAFRKMDGEKRLILRALPLVVPEKYKKLKSDTHLWPKGTFIQVNNTPCLLQQRKQQSHDEKLWKGMCQQFDLTEILNSRNVGAPLKVEVCAKDTDAYNFQLAICKYTPPQKLFEKCIGNNNGSIMKLSFEEGRALLQQNLDQKDAVVLDDSDGDDDASSVDESNIYSLLCGVSMAAIQTPVRGKNCKHIQCFDLRNYLHSNVNVSGGRWRCVVCEDFVSVQDLMIDGFMAKILEDHGKDVSTSRDKIKVYRDGTYELLSHNRLRFQKKRPASGGEQSNAKRSKVEQQQAATEVIDILDDDED